MLNVLRKLYIVLKKIIIQNPVIILLKKWEYNNTFTHAEKANLFNGVYGSFDEALENAPSTKKIGYDNPEPASMYKDRLEKVYPADYPVMFWLNQLIQGSRVLFDLGGHIGISYYAYKKYLKIPSNHKWLICDVSAVIEAGENFASEKNERGLNFTTDYKMGDGCDIILASGSLQYIDQSLSSIISNYKKKPSSVIVNLLPVYDGETFVTLQNIGTVFCPYRIFNKDEFVESMRNSGYILKDIWENAEKSMTLPFCPEKSLDSYHGMYFAKQ